MAVLCTLTGVICFKYLPETANKPTPERMVSVIAVEKLQPQKIVNQNEQDGEGKFTSNVTETDEDQNEEKMKLVLPEKV